MKVLELVEIVLEGTNLNTVLEINKYVSIEDKRNIALEALEECSYDDGGFIRLDRFKEHIYFTIAMLREYTQLEFSYDFDGMVNEYDMLSQYGVMKVVMDVVGDDFKFAEHILNLEEKQLIEQNDTNVQIVKLVNAAMKALGDLTESIEDKIKDLDMEKILPEGTDANNLLSMLNKLK